MVLPVLFCIFVSKYRQVYNTGEEIKNCEVCNCILIFFFFLSYSSIDISSLVENSIRNQFYSRSIVWRCKKLIAIIKILKNSTDGLVWNESSSIDGDLKEHLEESEWKCLEKKILVGSLW